MLAEGLANIDWKMKDVFFHFAWPVKETDDGLTRDRGVLLEKLVMGEGYDSTQRGKYARRDFWNGYDDDEEDLAEEE